MIVTYDGHPCVVPDPGGQLQEWYERFLEHQVQVWFPNRSPAMDRAGHISSPPREYEREQGACMPTWNWPPMPRLRLNNLYWPSGATRWSVGIVLLMQDAVKAVYSSRSQSKVLTLTDDTVPNRPSTVSANMWMRAAYPVYLDTAHPQGTLYVCILVDERWFWQLSGTDLATVPTQSMSGNKSENPWATTMLTTLASWYNLANKAIKDTTDLTHAQWNTFPISSASGDAGRPHPHVFGRQVEPTALLLDAIAASCMLRVVSPYGTTANTSQSNSRGGSASSVIRKRFDTPRAVRGSVTQALSALQNKMYGNANFGQTSGAAICPSTIGVVFPRFNLGRAMRTYGGLRGGAGNVNGYTWPVRIIPSGDDSLEGGESLSGGNWTYQLYCSAYADFTTTDASDFLNRTVNPKCRNDDVLADIADYLGTNLAFWWTGPQYDLTIPGIYAWPHTGYDDAVLFEFGCQTRGVPRPDTREDDQQGTREWQYRFQTRVWSLPPECHPQTIPNWVYRQVQNTESGTDWLTEDTLFVCLEEDCHVTTGARASVLEPFAAGDPIHGNPQGSDGPAAMHAWRNYHAQIYVWLPWTVGARQVNDIDIAQNENADLLMEGMFLPKYTYVMVRWVGGAWVIHAVGC